MPRRAPDPDDDEDDWDDGDDSDDPDEIPTVPCRYCRREMSEDAQRCPYCENYVSAEDAPPAPRSRFWAVMMALALLVALWWAVR